MRKQSKVKQLALGTALAVSVALAACSDPAAEQARVDAIDHKNCVELGFEPNTEAYGNCRLKMKEIRAKEEGSRSPNVGFGLGVGIGL